MLVPGDLADPAHRRSVVAKAVEEFGRVDVLVSNAAFQMDHTSLQEIPDEERDRTIATNLSAFFHLAEAAVPPCRPGQPAELALVHVLPASDEDGHVSGARVAVTGGKPIL